MANTENNETLLEIGRIFDEIGLKTVESAKMLIEHLKNCPGGTECFKKLGINKE